MKKYLLDLPIELHTAVKAKAAMEQTTLKAVITKLLKEWVEKGR